MITVVGLGVENGDLTERGKRVILEAAKAGKPIVARTAACSCSVRRKTSSA